MKIAMGVYFRREDYATFWVRVLVDLIDLITCGALCTMLSVPMILVLPPSNSTLNLIVLTWTATAVSYFVLLKRSRFRTLGYRVGRVRIVGLDGLLPSYWSLVWRLLFGLLPMNWLVDLIWLSGDTHRQALRDKFANTYVVKAQAQPAGQGRVVCRYYDIGFYNFLFREVEVTQP